MKTIIAIAVSVLLSANNFPLKNANRLMDLFKQTFPSAYDVKWHQDENGYVVFFKLNDITNQISYNAQEEFIEQRRYYDEQNLPAYILLAVKKNFPAKKIWGVTEIMNASSVYYQIHLKDNNVFNTIHVSADGTVTLEKTFTNDEQK